MKHNYKNMNMSPFDIMLDAYNDNAKDLYFDIDCSVDDIKVPKIVSSLKDDLAEIAFAMICMDYLKTTGGYPSHDDIGLVFEDTGVLEKPDKCIYLAGYEKIEWEDENNFAGCAYIELSSIKNKTAIFLAEELVYEYYDRWKASLHKVYSKNELIQKFASIYKDDEIDMDYNCYSDFYLFFD